jgi:DNA-binding XRE family transcriptional regulator
VAKIQDWLEEDNLIRLEGWARDGLTNEQIAKNIGIDERTLYRWKEKESLICQALKRSREVVDFEVENALLKSALEGNVTAQIFWLKNRKKEQWREKQEYSSDQELAKLDELLEEQRNAYLDN